MTIWSIPLRGVRGKRPNPQIKGLESSVEEWKKGFAHDTRPIIDGDCPSVIELPNLDGMTLCHYEYNGEDIAAKFSGEYDFAHLTPHLSTIYCEIVIDDSHWKGSFMPDYPKHNEIEKYQTVQTQAMAIITALRLIGFNRFIAPCILKNSTLKNAHMAGEGTIEFLPNHLFQIPMAFLEGSKSRITKKELAWVCRAVRTLNHLYFFDDLTPVMTAMSYYYDDIPSRAKMTLIWAAIEDLLKPNQGKIRFSIRARAAMMIGTSDSEIKDKFKQVGKLYNKRSAATHGRKFTWAYGLEDISKNKRLLDDMESLIKSYKLLCDIFYCIVDRGAKFTNLELSSLEEEYIKNFS